MDHLIFIEKSDLYESNKFNGKQIWKINYY
jgi:hypothetical protein